MLNYFPILAKGANFFPLPPATENVNFVHPWLHHILNPYGNYYIWMLTPCFVSVSAWSEVFLPDPEQQVLEAGGRVWAHFNTIHF